jgi:hypothetical protein
MVGDILSSEEKSRSKMLRINKSVNLLVFAKRVMMVLFTDKPTIELKKYFETGPATIKAQLDC